MTTAASRDAATAPRLHGVERILCIGLGASFHLLSTPTIAGVEVRLSLSDMLLGVMLLGAVLSWRALAAQWVAGLMRRYLWLLAVFVLLVLAYARGGVYTDSAATWAQLKIVGFGVLSAYFVVSSLLALRRGEQAARLVAQGFVAGAWVSAVAGLVEYSAYFYFDHPIEWGARIAALSENPNSFGITLAAAVALDLGTAQSAPLFPKRLSQTGAAIVLVAIFLSASRSAYLGMAAGVLWLVVLQRYPPTQMLRHVAAAALLFATLFVAPPALIAGYETARTAAVDTSAPTSSATRPAQQTSRASPAPKENYAVTREQVDLGARVRIDLAREASSMWWHHPWLGAGLGAFWRAQQARDVPFPYVNHNTTLWLASEMGALGVLLFMGGVVWATIAFLGVRHHIALAGGAGAMLCVLFGASIGAEVAYQRYAWCLCGLVLGLMARSEAAARSDADATITDAS